MDGIHDIGGMDGTGPVEREPDEPVFHEVWEGRVFGMQMAKEGAAGAYNVDEFRHAIERMDPAYYLDSSYYEHWLVAIEKLFVEKGVLSAAELRERVEELGTARAFDEGLPERRDPGAAERAREAIESGGSTRRDPVEPAFEAGDAVVVREMHPEGHTRCPEYVRGARGAVEEVHGTFVLPDTNAHGEGERPEPVYHVRFGTDELWGEGVRGGDAVYVDLWERYLRGADG